MLHRILLALALILSGCGAAVAQNLCGTITTNGSGQSFNAPVTLTCDTTINDTGNGAIVFNSTVDGSYHLTVITGGLISMGGTFGTSQALTGLSLSGGSVTLESISGVCIGPLALTASSGGSIAVDGSITQLTGVAFSGATPNGTGTLTGTGAITGIGGTTFNLVGSTAGQSGGITFIGFIAADATVISGALGFDDAALSGNNMTFGSATNVSGTGTITDVTGNFMVGNRKSAASGITYSGFTAVAGSGSAATLTGAGQTYTLAGSNTGSVAGLSWNGFGNISDSTGTINFGTGSSLSGDVTAMGLDYAGYGGAVTFDAADGNGTTTGIGGQWNDVAGVIGSGNTDTVAGLGTAPFTLTGIGAGTAVGIAFSSFETADTTNVIGATNFDDTTRTSEGVAFPNAIVVSGSGTVSNVAGSFADDTGTSATSGITYSGFGTITGSGGTVSGISGNFDVATRTSIASGINYSGFNLGSISGSGAAATLAGSGQTYALTGSDAGSVAGLSWNGFGNISDSTGTISFGTGGSLTGDVSASTLDYGTFPGAVNVTLGGGGTSGIGGSVTGVGTIHAGGVLAVQGTTSGALSISNTGSPTSLGALNVPGALAITAAGSVLQTGALTVAGTTMVDAGTGDITLTNASNALTGLVTLTGASAALTNQAALQVAQVNVTGALALAAPDVVNAGSISFGTGATTAAISGNYTQTGTLALHGTATSTDHLLVSGTANLGGAVDVAFGTTPSSGQVFPLVNAGSVSGSFSSLNVTGLAAGQPSAMAYPTNAAALVLATAQTLTINAPANVAIGSSPFTVTVTASSGLPVTLTSTTPAVCMVSNASSPFSVQILAMGTCSLTAAQAGDMATNPVSQVVTVRVDAPAYVPVPTLGRWMLLLLVALVGFGSLGSLRRRT